MEEAMTRSARRTIARIVAVPALTLGLLAPAAAAGAQEYGDEWSPEAQQPGDEWSPEVQQPGDEWSPEAQQPGDEWSGDAQQPGDEWSGEQRYDDAWYGQPSSGGRYGLFGLL